MNTDWRPLDRRILEYIDKNPGETPANSFSLCEFAKVVAPRAMYGWRIVDRRTQVLRKNGLIEYVRPMEGGRRYWALTSGGRVLLREGKK